MSRRQAVAKPATVTTRARHRRAAGPKRGATKTAKVARRRPFNPLPPVLAALALLAAGFWLVVIRPLPSAADMRATLTRPVRETAMMRLRKAEAKEQHRTLKVRQSWVELDAVSPALVSALIASEDARFFDHHGLDFRQIHAALKQDVLAGKPVRGASTLSMQVAKNLYLSGEKSLSRKLEEALLTERLEAALTKERILTLYLNVAEWGDGVFGVEAGARAHLGKSAGELDLAESAALVAMLPNPRRFTPAAQPKELHRRAVRVLSRIGEEGFATSAELDGARQKLDDWLLR